MKDFQRYGYTLCLLLVTLTAACAPIKNLEVWKDEAYNQQLQKVLVITLAQQDIIRNQFENVLANQLAKHGVEAIPSHKVLTISAKNPDRDAIVAKVRELGVSSVLVSRSISKKEITNHQYGGVVQGGAAVYDSHAGWYGFSYGYGYNREYDTDYFTVATRLFDVDSQKPVWSYLSQIKVSGSRQGAVNLLVPTIVTQLEESQLLKLISE